MTQIKDYLATLRKEHENYDVRDIEMKRVKVDNLHPSEAKTSQLVQAASY